MRVHKTAESETPTSEDLDGAPEPNSGARAETIKEVCETIGELDRQIAGLKAERKATIETRIVADLGMSKSHFSAVYKLAQMDQGDRDGLFDAMREMFGALSIGQQLNWLDVAGAAGGGSAAA